MSCYCDYDPPEFVSTVWRKARKAHNCCECGHEIARGEVYERVSGKWEGFIDTFITCQNCVDLRAALKEVGCPAYGGLFEEYTEYLESIPIQSDETASEISHRVWSKHRKAVGECHA